MEVSGRRGSSGSLLSCQPCQGDGDTVPAKGYCENCNQFICSSCIKAHRKLAVTKNHVIKSKDEMPTFLAAIRSAPCTVSCEVHENEIVKYYCQEHNDVGCGDCMILEHTSCKVQFVADVSCNYDDSDELVLIKHRIDHIQKNLKSCKREIELSLKTADEIKDNIIKEIKKFRKEMDTYLDKVEKDLMQEVGNVSAGDVNRQEKLQDQCKTTIKDIEKMRGKIEQYKDNVNDLFVSSKRVHNKLQKCQVINEEISANSQINTFKLTPSEVLNAFMVDNALPINLDTRVEKFSGQCEKSIIDMETMFVKTANVKGKGEKDCSIVGVTILSDAEILCADFLNTSLKVLNHKEGKITSSLKTSCPPADVTTINASSAATTLYQEGMILFVNTQNGLSISHGIKVRENCHGIDHHNGIVAVTFLNPPAVQVLDMEGSVLHEVKDASIIKSPRYVSLGNDNKCMFVSDSGNRTVHEFTLQGHLKTSIASENMKTPAKIAVSTCGSIVVCEPNKSDKVGVILSGTSEFLPLHVQHTKMPFVIRINDRQRKLFISEYYKSKDANYIKIFDLK